MSKSSGGKRSKCHSQRGMSMGVCPNCMKDMWQGQATVVTPVERPNPKLGESKFEAVLAHATCSEGE